MFEKAGLLETYKPQGADGLKEIFRDGRDPYTWTGMDAYLGVVCFNTAEAGKDKVATPTSWKDLTNPALKGKVVMPHPASSGTGYLMVAGWLQSMGEQEGWKFMDGLHENIAAYLHSGSAPACRRRAANASPASPSTCAAPPRRARARRIEVVIPKEGVGWEMEATADRQGQQEPRRRQEDRRLGRDEGGQRALLQDLRHRRLSRASRTRRRTIRPTPKRAMIKNDLGWMAENRDRILAEWSKRYESKAAPKN